LSLLNHSENKCAYKLYADDLKLYTVLHADEDCGNLQDKLNAIYDWLHNWQLGISYKKSNTNCKPSLLLNNVCLVVVDEVNDLGVVIVSRLTVHTHFVKCFISRDAFTLLRAFKVYVRPIHEYASCTWSPHHILKIQQVETVQRKFTKRHPGYVSLCYKERLSRLGLDTMEMHRLWHDLLYTYKIVFNLVSGAANVMFTLANTLYSTRTRGHPHKLYSHNRFIDVRKHFFCERKHFFCERIVITWNNLPGTSEYFSSFSQFKYFINSVNLTSHVSLGF